MRRTCEVIHSIPEPLPVPEDRAKMSADLAQSRRHVRKAEQRIAKQRQRVADLESDGHDTTEAMHLLVSMEGLLSQMKVHRDFEANELAKIKKRARKRTQRLT